MERWNNRVAVVTGGSAGIGKAIARDLLKAGLRVVALARRIERLEEIQSELPKDLQARYYPRKTDITNKAKVKETFDWIEKTLGGTDILVNNAGILRFGNLVEVDTKIVDDVLNTNVKGLIYATQSAYKSMKDRNVSGHIVHVNSIFGHRVLSIPGVPGINVYSASKFAVTAINDTLRNELRSLGSRIKTTSISPGGTRSELLAKENFESQHNILEAEDVSQAVLFAISTPEHVQIDELTLTALGEPY